ncbi:MAG: hypothetical protein IJ170_00265 [Ruminococcus sp.]|nr:hypothetical protein [Ruminococcus sp.]MBQ8121736.1 hypothetical protein [Ruminococcus sp.]HBB20063.1 hypothetical protein [Ruminococcus sp.]HOO07296.1 hypothetical protein [Ruminococcus sp.]HOR21541.1 hypothetical protein [Ruminococcus sp.]
MRYLPILEELFNSDSVFFLMIGFVIAIMIGAAAKRRKIAVIALAASAAVYGLCELFMNIGTNYLSELLLLVVGTAAIGCIIGNLICIAAQTPETA